MELRAEVTEENAISAPFKTRQMEYNIENVEQLEYLGVTVTNNGQEGKEIDKRNFRGKRTLEN